VHLGSATSMHLVGADENGGGSFDHPRSRADCPLIVQGALHNGQYPLGQRLGGGVGMHEYESLVRHAFDLLEHGDLEGYVACFTDDIVQTNPVGVFRGKADVLAYNHQMLRETLAVHFRRVEHLVVSGESVAVRLAFGGTVAATGRSFEVEVCAIFDVRDGKVCAVTEYVDFTEAQAAFVA
jgi:ketosteroid isomerase-like protein